MKRFSTCAALAACLLLPVAAHGDSAQRPDDHAPIGVMGDHTHQAGEWMLSWRRMAMTMEGNRDGTDDLSTSEVLRSGTGAYMVAPTRMTMVMHMLGVMYAPSDSVTLMAMLPWVDNEMDHVTAMGGRFSTDSGAMGDLKLAALIPSGRHTWTLGLSVPTGDLDQRDTTPMGRSVLPYPMQIGSGTYDLTLGWGHLTTRPDDSFGAQIKGTFRLGENDEGYTKGHELGATAWYARRLSERLSVSLRGTWTVSGNYDGADPRYAMALANRVVATVDPDRRAGNRLEFGLGANLTLEGGHRLSLEAAAPVRQDLDGPQLQVDRVWTLGWQWAL